MKRLTALVCDICCNDSTERKEIVQFGLELILDSIIQTIVIFTGAWLSGRFMECFIIYITFTLVRKHAGGHHANTGLRCLVLMILMIIFGIIVNELIRLPIPFLMILYVACMSCLWIWAPSSTNNNPISKPEIRKYKNEKHLLL